MSKLLLVLSLFLVGCTTGQINPDRMCIIHEKRFFNGEFIEVYNVDRRCE